LTGLGGLIRFKRSSKSDNIKNQISGSKEEAKKRTLWKPVYNPLKKREAYDLPADLLQHEAHYCRDVNGPRGVVGD